MTDIFHRRYEPYFNRGIEELKFSPKRAKRKPLHSTKLTTNKLFSDGFTKKSLLTKKNPANIGKYILTDINPATCLCQAYHIGNKKEYTCRVIEISKYREVVTPYFHIQSHEHINEIVEIILGEQFAYIFFETSYGDLHSYVRSKRRLKEEEASQFFQQIVEVVKYCHQNGLVLRDLKLRKFVFKDKARKKKVPHVEAGDRDMCFSFQSELVLNELLYDGVKELKLLTLDDCYIIKDNSDILFDKHGCPAYVSPEILESNRGYSSKAADIWSLGVMIYTMVCGRYPFHELDPLHLFAKIKTGTFAITEPLSPKCRCLIYSILRKNPDERLSAEELLEHPWFTSDFTLCVINRPDRKRTDQQVPEIEIKF